MAGFFSSDTLERIRAASDIVDVIGGYLPLKKAGGSFVALCPFHREKTPSFHVNPHRQIFHCFGCNKGGDVFSFVKEFENLDFPEAVRRLAERARVPLEHERAPGEQQSRYLKEKLLEIHLQIAQRWQNALANEASGALARDYLEKRRVSPQAVALFRLGAAPDLWDDTVNWARSKGHDLELVEKAGLILKKEGGGYYDRFRGRLMFPICDEQGRIIGFSGRILAGDEKTAKYVNSPETPIFTKSKVFFGPDKSKRPLIEAGNAIVCEGQLDLIACYMAGVQNVVAPQGTAFTPDHARILKRYVDEVILCFDSDEAGQNAAVRSLDPLLASGLAIKVAVVPAPHDPDSFIKENGVEAFQQLIADAEGFFDFLLARLCRLNLVNTDKGRLAVLRSMAEAVLKTNNMVLIDKYAQQTALQLGVSPDSVRAEFRKVPRPATIDREALEETQPVQAEARPNQVESWLLKLVFLGDDLAQWAAAHLDPSWIQHGVVKEAVAQRLRASREQTWNGLPAFLDDCASPEMQSLLTEAVIHDKPLPNPEQQLSDLVLRLRNQVIDRESALLKGRAGQPGTAEAEALDLLRRQQILRDKKREPLKPLPEG